MTNLHTIESFTEKNKRYVIRQMPDGDYRCSCPDFVFRERKKQKCKHVDRFLFEKGDQKIHQA